MKKARSWLRRLLQHGLLGDGAGVRGSPDEVLDVRERPPVPHLCTNHEIRTMDDEWRRRRRKQLNHPRMDQQLGPPPPTSDAGHGLPRHGPPILISRLHPRRRPAHSASGSDSRNVPPRSPCRNRRDSSDAPAGGRGDGSPTDAGAPGRRGAYERSGAAAALIITAATATSL